MSSNDASKFHGVVMHGKAASANMREAKMFRNSFKQFVETERFVFLGKCSVVKIQLSCRRKCIRGSTLQTKTKVYRDIRL